MAECVESFFVIKRTAQIFSLSRGGRGNASKLSDNVLESIELLFKFMKLGEFGREIRERLLNDGVCDGRDLPALLTVNRGVKIKLRVINKYSIKQRLHPSPFLIFTSIELSISTDLKIFSWNSTFQRNLSSSNVIFAKPLKEGRLLEDSDLVFNIKGKYLFLPFMAKRAIKGYRASYVAPKNDAQKIRQKTVKSKWRVVSSNIW